MKRRKTARSLTALDVLKVAAGQGELEPLIDTLVTLRKFPSTKFAAEAWTVVAEREGRPDVYPGNVAVEHQKAAIMAKFSIQPFAADPTEDTMCRLNKLVAAASTGSLTSYGDGYQDLRLRLMLPVARTVFATGFAPYRAAADFWGDKTNSMVRPLLTTPLKDILATPPPAGTDGEDAWFCAAVVVLRELTDGYPIVYVGPSVSTAADDDLPSIAVDRGCFGDNAQRGIVVGDTFTPARHTLCAWLAAAASHPAVNPVASLVLNGKSGGTLDHLLSSD